MGAKSVYRYESDPKVRSLIDWAANGIAVKIEDDYAVVGPTLTLIEILRFFLIHSAVIVVKIPPLVPGEPWNYAVIHPEYDDVRINMEPIPRLTMTRYLPMSQKQEVLALGEDRFKIYEGSLADINLKELLHFLEYKPRP